jgi:RNA polymerase sigma factor (sigma-70 family)
MNEGRVKTVDTYVPSGCWPQLALTSMREMRVGPRCYARERRPHELWGLLRGGKARGRGYTRLGVLDALGWEPFEVKVDEVRVQFQKLWDSGWVAQRARESTYNDERAHDVCAELFLSVRGLGEAQAAEIELVEPYLLGKILDLLREHLRAVRRERSRLRKHLDINLPELEKALSFSPTPLDEIQALETIEVTEQAILKLSPQRRRAFLLRLVEHRSIQEIARELRIAEKTVRNHLSTATALILAELDRVGLNPVKSLRGPRRESL